MSNKTHLEKLFQPFRLGSMELRNRIVMPPMGTNYSTEEGYVTDQLKDYYEERAKGGAGLVIIEATCVDSPVGKAFTRQVAIDEDKFLPGLSQLVQVIHQHGARVAVQLHHAGNGTKSSITHCQPVAPSPITRPGYDPPRELSLEEIEEIILRFGQAAERAKRAGFDGVEVHAAHLYLPAQFLSLAWNRRQDAYGGTPENRARFPLEVLRTIRDRVGSTYPVWFRINGREYGIEDGITLDETRRLAVMLQEAGADALHVSAMAYPNPRSVPPMSVRPGTMLSLAEAVKSVVTIPVIAVGSISPELGERVLQEGKADLIAIGRGLIADPELPNKAAMGRWEEIIPCLSCNTCMEQIVDWDRSLCCVINAAVGREKEYVIAPAPKPKMVLIVGGGPAGMEAARVAKLRGHQVELWEKKDSLGGQLLLAALPPHKEGIPVLLNYLIKRVDDLGVRVKLRREITTALIEERKPEVVVLATGAKPLLPEIAGIDSPSVVLSQDVLLEKREVGDRVIVIGGEQVGCETAEFLADKGKRVTITRRGPRMAEKMAPSVRENLLLRLDAKGITMLTGVKYENISDRGLTLTTGEGKRLTIKADTIVLAAGATPDTELFQTLQGKVEEIYRAGDCIQPRRMLDAMQEGSAIGRRI